MAHVKTKGFVVRVVPVGESDRIISLLTEDQGLISVSVRGARRTRSPHLMTTQIFSFSTFELFYNKGHYSINVSELIEPFSALQQDIDRLVCASHLAEVLIDSLRDDLAQPGVYRLWAYGMQAISRQPDPFLSVHVVQLRLLMEIGFAPRLDSCVLCGSPIEQMADDALYFSIAAGGLICGRPVCHNRAADRQDMPPGGLACLQHILRSALPRLFSFTLAPDVRRFVIDLSARYLNHQMEKAYTRLDMIRHLHADFEPYETPQTDQGAEPTEKDDQSDG
ncbi:MAG: DNA repair protein RecO [Bacillota bacterium]|nr:DNA repair protein RecO [Bacillota bacterium]